MNYGKELKAHRESKNISQSELAKKIGVNQATISLWEDNKRTPTIDNCVAMADFYEITLDELIGRDFKKNW
ncbi:MAG: helix-turn-helix transcriptional regulator [Clostridiales bacterium]|jgi:transcriptional regulator with XRE-family HTH domain|nr:helix-turn-helix transcriptional regulator [Clostridiales bacterium]